MGLNRRVSFGGILIGICLFSQCTSSPPSSPPLFELRPPEETGIHFANTIEENEAMNILNFEYLYHGGGVAIADFNQDSLPDLFFTGNQVPNRLYLNQGNLSFKDISETAGITAPQQWSNGVSVVDINADNKLDLYIANSVHTPGSSRANLLFVNQGNNEAGIPLFEEQATTYGIADTGHSVMSAFFDYDLDGDLDLYVLTHETVERGTNPSAKAPLGQGQSPNTDRLYRNEGDGSFTPVSQEAGILFEGYGMGMSIRDFNLDNYPDIYLSNDYLSNDLLYINQKDGTFRNEIQHYLKHQSYSAKGHDVADINQDGLEDIFTVDVLPENHERKKLVIPGNNYSAFINARKYGYDYQYVRNTLQVNNGPGPEAHPTFSELSHLSGLEATDWSWAPLVSDVDNDEDRDLLITNGLPKDISDLDFQLFRQRDGQYLKPKNLQRIIREVKIANYAFENRGNLTFHHATHDWGIHYPSFSHGAALGDLDLDGDLDYVVNNINDSAFLFENRGEVLHPTHHFLRIVLVGSGKNTQGLGARMSLHYGEGKRQVYTHSPYRGYLSTVESIAHFGLGAYNRIDSLQIFWPDGSYQLLTQIPCNQQIHVYQDYAKKREDKSWKKDVLFMRDSSTLFKRVSQNAGLNHLHEEQEKFDFTVQYTLPHKFSQSGPGIAVGDLNNDGLDDVYIGGSSEYSAQAFIQEEQGTFSPFDIPGITVSKEEEDMGILFFDADGDRDQDLYLVSGSYEYPVGHTAFRDRLFFNEGDGKFTYRPDALPDLRSSGSCVRATDIDKDGDLDLFVGGRVVSGRYPENPESYLLINEDGNFSDQTPTQLKKVGMVSDGLWTDVDNDGWIDLLLVGEWMPITLFSNKGGTLEKQELPVFAKQKGWWNSIQSGDFDKDGDMDYLAGNLGLNSSFKGNEEYPLHLLAKDFDNNGSMDPIIFSYLPNETGQRQLHPIHARDDLIKQVQQMSDRFPLYEDYGQSSYETLLTTEEKEGALSLTATYFQSVYIENLGDRNFALHPLPIEAQYAPINGIQVQDFNGDGELDALLTGNNYSVEIFSGRQDAGEGLILVGDGTGNFKPLPRSQSGLDIRGDAKALAWIHRPGQAPLYVATQNRDSLRVFSASSSLPLLTYTFEREDAYALLSFPGAKIQKVEVHHGSSYLSQSSRVLSLPKACEKVVVYSFLGKEKQIK